MRKDYDRPISLELQDSFNRFDNLASVLIDCGIYKVLEEEDSARFLAGTMVSDDPNPHMIRLGALMTLDALLANPEATMTAIAALRIQIFTATIPPAVSSSPAVELENVSRTGDDDERAVQVLARAYLQLQCFAGGGWRDRLEQSAPDVLAEAERLLNAGDDEIATRTRGAIMWLTAVVPLAVERRNTYIYATARDLIGKLGGDVTSLPAF